MMFMWVSLLSVVEGLTEFLPISSTFHLLLAARLFALPESAYWKLFEVFIQSGAILAVVLLYTQELRQNTDLTKKTLIAFVPTAMVGFVLYKVIKQYFLGLSLLTVSVFFVVGMVFILVELLIKKEHIRLTRPLATLTYQEAVIIGLVQSLAVVPGVSRAGAVIVGLIVLGFRRDEAAKCSFLLAVPTVFAAAFFDLYKMRAVLISSTDNMLSLLLGFVLTFAVAYGVVRWLLNYLKKNTLTAFGIYRIVLSVLIFMLLK